MTVTEFIDELKQASPNPSNTEIRFIGEIEVSIEDEFKTFPVKYEDCSVKQQHPSILTVYLHTN